MSSSLRHRVSKGGGCPFKPLDERLIPGAMWDALVGLDGSLLPETPLPSVPSAFQPWEDTAKLLPILFADKFDVRKTLSEMPVLDAGSSATLPDGCLPMANVLLTRLATAWWNSEKDYQVTLPDCIFKPLKQVKDRLGRLTMIVTLFDSILANFECPDPAIPPSVNNFQLRYLLIDHEEERLFYGVVVEMTYCAKRFGPQNVACAGGCKIGSTNQTDGRVA